MTEKEENNKTKPSSKQPKSVLAFYIRLRLDIKTACQQIENGLGQEDITINEEVEKWLNK
ncbi:MULTISPECIES: hypothetical protein [Bacteroides]|jgi:hypothetical protein|uniref:hypothetical protein n=1 Tax=Bacteroides TaxID=816 RepID=UPI000C7595B0|nr:MULTISPECIES: hypothetical protein [Bacteroides]RGM48771.1 hypothetical protein DXC10_03915 [Bacteroides sp. OM08-11]